MRERDRVDFRCGDGGDMGTCSDDWLVLVDHRTAATCSKSPVLCTVALVVVASAFAPASLVGTCWGIWGHMHSDVEGSIANPPGGLNRDTARRLQA